MDPAGSERLLEADGASHDFAQAHISEGLSFGRAVLSLAISMIGTGIVAFPFAFALCGVSGAFVFVLIMAIFAHEAYLSLLRCCEATGISSYDGMISTLPAYWRYAANASLCLLLILASTSYVVIGANTSRVVLGAVAGKSMAAAVPNFVFFGVVIIVNIPLGCSRSMSGLSGVTNFNFVALVLLTIILSWQSIQQRLDAPPESETVQVTNFMKIVCSLPIYGTANFGHMNYPSIYAELRRESKPNAAYVSLAACFLASLVYCSLGLTGYLAFGGDAQSDVVAQLAMVRETTAVHFAQAMVIAIVTTKTPLLVFPLRVQVLSVISPKQTVQDLSWSHNISLTVASLSVIFFFALLLPDLGSIMDILGALCCVPLTFVVPALLAFQHPGQGHRKTPVWRSVGLGLTGVLISMLALVGVYVTHTKTSA
eukprot:TRINITY_DN76793_c0_g1_i1.p1 TRINITY_DN76793_c0_g1~~TRINITY_DN76793_c0_g1_i1.p1  ORF type:complete len:476 (+),score=42.26 TRINITY_DN76793_c0_g1_i1:151-1428(+)